MALKDKKFRILFAGGGSAGHIIPALVVLKKFSQIYPKSDFLYVSETSELSRKIVNNFKKENNLKLGFEQISAGKLHRYLTPALLTMPFKILLGIWQSFKIVNNSKPQAVFLKGGYVCVPVAIAAVIFRVPIILHETDSSFGLANRLIIPFAKKVAMSYPRDLGEKFIYTGNPVRESFFKKSTTKNKEFTILAFGGSLGSRNLNNLISKITAKITPQNKVVHITGQHDFESLNKLNLKNYTPIAFTSKIDELMAKSDLIISRAGGSVFEIAALEKPAILIPLSTAGSRGDQIENAQILKKSRAAVVLNEEDLSPEKLLNKINELRENKDKRSELSKNISKFAKKDAPEKITSLIIESIS